MKIWKLLAGVFCGIGIVFALVGVLVYTFENREYKNLSKMEGTIESIRERPGSHGNEWHEVKVAYELDGEIVLACLDTYTMGMQEGDTVSFYVDPEKPWNLKSKAGSYIMLAIFGTIGGIFMIIGVCFLVVIGKFAWRARRLKQNGMCLRASVVGIERDERMHVNGSCGKKLLCMYEDVFSGEKMLFQSENLFRSMENVEVNPTAYTVNVYVDPLNTQNYYVDPKSLQGVHLYNGEPSVM